MLIDAFDVRMTWSSTFPERPRARLIDVVLDAHEALLDNLPVGDDALCVELTRLALELRDVRDQLIAVDTSRGIGIGSTVPHATLISHLATAVRDPETPAGVAMLLARLALGLQRAQRWREARE